MADHAKPLEGVTFRTSDLTNTPTKIATWAPCRARRLHICCKGCHFAQATERPRAQTTKPRQEPPGAPPPPDASFSLKNPSPGARWASQPLPRSSVNDTLTRPTPHPHRAQRRTTRAPAGGGGLPLPAAASAAPHNTIYHMTIYYI